MGNQLYFLISEYIYILCIFCSHSLIAGISADTLIYTMNGKKEVKFLQKGEGLFGLDNENNIITLQKKIVNNAIKIVMEGNVTITVGREQRFYVNNSWIKAKDLSPDDILLGKNGSFIRILNIQYINKPTLLYFIKLSNQPYFWATENDILLHNGPISAYYTYCAVKMSLYTGLAYLTGGTVAAGAKAAEVANAAYTAGASLLSSTVATGIFNGVSAVGAASLAASGVSTGAGIAGGTAITVAGIVGGAEAGATVTSIVAGVSAVITVSGASAANVGFWSSLKIGASFINGAIETISTGVSSCVLSIPWLP